MNLKIESHYCIQDLQMLVQNDQSCIPTARTYLSELVIKEVGKLHLSVKKEKKVFDSVAKLLDFFVSNWLDSNGRIKKVNLLNIRTIWLSVKLLRNTIVDIIKIRKSRKL